MRALEKIRECMKMNDKIIESVDKCIEVIGKDFEDNPSLFYTENDIVCYFYKLLQGKLSEEGVVADKNNCKHFLVHREYPTPFKCYMKEYEFKKMVDSSTCIRGHYDIVVLNPDFIKNETYDIIKAQDFSSFKDKVKNYPYPIVLYGLEFMYSRNPFKSEQEIERFVKKVNQDADKLEESCKGFMKKSKMLVFVKDREDQVRQGLKDEIKVFFGKDRSK
jgi:hypothetical protein